MTEKKSFLEFLEEFGLPGLANLSMIESKRMINQSVISFGRINANIKNWEIGKLEGLMTFSRSAKGSSLHLGSLTS